MVDVVDREPLELVLVPDDGAVEGAYGTGKSSYLRMCAAHLRQLGARTVEFNAWQQGHTGPPLIDMVAALAANLHGKGSWEKVKTTAKQVGWRTAGYLTRGIVAPNEPDDSSMFDDWIDIETNMSEFKESLHAQVQECGGKLVIFVDELDRCEPIYALDLLNKARHLFDVPGVVIVFGINRAELGHAVETQYGPDCDVDGYLRRFVDLSIQLRQPTTEEWVTCLTGICEGLSDCSPTLSDGELVTRKLLTLLADNCGGRLRDVEQVARHVNMLLPLPNYRQLWPRWVICLLTLRYVDRGCYERFVTGATDEWEVLQVFRKHLLRDDAVSRRALMDAVVLSLPGECRMPYVEDEFVDLYLRRTDGDQLDAQEAFRHFDRILDLGDLGAMPSLEVLHRTIEIAAPN